MLIEGYTDTHAEYFRKKPLFTGGEPSIPSFYKVDPPNDMSITNSTISMFTGVSNPDLVRTFSLWNDREFMNVQKTTATGVRSSTTETVSPWNGNVNVNGTDGYQFQPDIQED